MSECKYLVSVSLLSLLVVSTRAQCTDQQTVQASEQFKDCIDKKNYELLHMDPNMEDKQEFICSMLEQLSSECSKALAKCREREYVDDKVAIHIVSFTGKCTFPS